MVRQMENANKLQEKKKHSQNLGFFSFAAHATRECVFQEAAAILRYDKIQWVESHSGDMWKHSRKKKMNFDVNDAAHQTFLLFYGRAWAIPIMILRQFLRLQNSVSAVENCTALSQHGTEK